jgi:integrase
MADLWLDHYENEKARRPSSVAQAKLVVENHLKPAFGSKPMPHIGRSDLQAVIDRVPLKQKAMRRTVFAYASVLFGWAAKRGDLPRNPLNDMAKPPAPAARDRVLIDDELKRVWSAATQLKKPWGAFYRIAILTGQRRDEVAKLHWSELDRAAATWTIPATRAKNGIAHIVPLSVPVMDELDALSPDVEGGDGSTRKWPKTGFVMTTNGRSAVSGFSKAKKLLDAAMEAERQRSTDVQPQAPWRVHDLRRTVATGLQRLGVRFEVTEAVLNHVSGAKGGIAGVYQRHDWASEKRAALGAWAGFVDQLVSGVCEDNVVRMEARA